MEQEREKAAFRGRAARAPRERTPKSGGSTSTFMLEQKARRETWAPVPDWHSRGYLPHCNENGLIQNITFRLFDSVPAETIAGWQTKLGINPGLAAHDPQNAELRRRIDRYEDAGHGKCWLRHQQIAELIQNTMLFFDGERYRLLEWCVMPNHVHALILPIKGYLTAKIVHSWKSYTGHAVKKLIDLAEPFWMAEYHDRFIRDNRHLEVVQDYIRQNPVTARLVSNAEDWQWSSANPRNAVPGSPGSAGGSPISANLRS